MRKIQECVNAGFPIRNPTNLNQVYICGNKRVPLFVQKVNINNFVLLCDDFVDMVKDNFEKVLDRAGGHYLYTRNLITGASAEDFALQSCFCYRPLSSKFYSPSSHNSAGDIECSDGYIGCKTTTTRVDNRVKLSMYRTNGIKKLKDKINHVSQCYTNMKHDIIWIKTIDKKKRMKKMMVLFCIPSKIAELDPKNYNFRKSKENWISNKMNGCRFEINSSTSSQFWWSCDDVESFVAKYKDKGIIRELDVNLEKYDDDFIPRLNRDI